MSICPICGGTGFLRQEVPVGHPEFGKLLPCSGIAHQPERMARLAVISGLHKSDLSTCLTDISPHPGNKAMLEAARKMVDSPYGWLFLWGGPGNAKSEVLIALVNEFNLSNRGPACYTKMSRLVEFMRDAYGERSFNQSHGADVMTYTQRFEKLLNLPVLAIDEMDNDKLRTTDFVREFRFDFLDERYRLGIEGQAITIFAGNHSPQEFELPIYDRFRDGRFMIVENTAPSARPAMKRG